MLLRALVLCSASWLASANALAAGPYLIEVRQVVASDGGANARFGQAVAIDGDTAVVGAPQDASWTGAVYIRARNQGGADNWGEVKKIAGSDPAPNRVFGHDVALSGDTAAVAATDSTVRIFERNAGGADNWGETKKIVIGAAGAGWSIALDGDTLVAGSPYEAIGPNTLQGAVYVFARDQGGAGNWGPVKKLLASDGAANDLFGTSVGIDGDSIIVSAIGADAGANVDQGAAYVFDRNFGGADNWGERRKLLAGDGGGNDQFGISVAIAADAAVVGAVYDDIGGNLDQGSAYVFARNQGGADQWGSVKKLVASTPSTFEQFGVSVSIDADTVVVGDLSAGLSLSAFNPGAAFVFQRNLGGANNWGELQKLVASARAGAFGAGFTDAVAVSGGTVVAGARYDDVGGNDLQGSAYVYDTVGGPDPTVIVHPLTVEQGTLIIGTLAVASDDATPPQSLGVNVGAAPPGMTLSGITNDFGRISATVAADCSVTPGDYAVSLQVTDGDANVSLVNLAITVAANTPPTVGTYSDATVGLGGAINLAASVPPDDAGGGPLLTLTASAPGFTGTFSGNLLTGTLTIASAGPAGTHTVTVTATDTCGATAMSTFSLTVLGALTTLSVNTTADTAADDGNCSLREAITSANTNAPSGAMPGECPAGLAGTDIIGFAIAGAGPHTIAPASPLPTATEPVIIDGATQPGASCATWPPTLRIVLNGSGAGAGADGLTLSAGNSVVRGLVIQEFAGSGINMHTGSNDVVQCNFLGTDVTGTLPTGNGIGVRSYPNGTVVPANLIGGPLAEHRNLISGNGTGVNARSHANSIVGNYIGSDVSGAAVLGNLTDGVFLVDVGKSFGAWIYDNLISGNGANGVHLSIGSVGATAHAVRNRIGTDASGLNALPNGANGILNSGFAAWGLAASDNLISGNALAGVDCGGGIGDFISGNRIGTDATGAAPLPNGRDGVRLSGGVSGPILAQVVSNRIAYNRRDGVRIEGTTVLGNLISANEIFENGGLGIDLGGDGVTANDAGDADSGPNHLQNFPALTLAVANNGTTTVAGTLSTAEPNSEFTMEFFANDACDPSGHGEGMTFLGSAAQTTDGSGNLTFQVVLPVEVQPGRIMTATAHISDSGSANWRDASEFSACAAVQGVAANNQPSLTPQTMSRQQGSPASVGTLATANDDFTAAGDLVPALGPLPAGISISGGANNGGSIDAVVGAACTAQLGDNPVNVQITDGGGLVAAADANVNVTANTPPALGAYPAVGPLSGNGTATPDAPPSDNGSVVSLVASAPGFTGSFSGDPLTGVVDIVNAGPAGHHVVTVTATDNCGAQSQRAFDLEVLPRVQSIPAPAHSWPLLAVLTGTLALLGGRIISAARARKLDRISISDRACHLSPPRLLPASAPRPRGATVASS
ncbi:MAG: CSLREA domain-containing protein [Deltaproteobacteria bacterium]|nr:CSLREA domain-containing protein [Deltaproteobacteria bacterium]